MSEQIYEPKVNYIPSEPRRRQGGIMRGCLMLGCAMVFLCCFTVFGIGAGFTALAAVVESNEQKMTRNESLDIESDHVNLVVESQVGNVNIKGSRNTDEIEVTLEMRATGFTEGRANERLEKIDYDVRRDGDDYIIEIDDDEADEDFNFIDGETSVDITITVPEELNITLTHAVGDVNINDVIIRDAMNITSDVGEVNFNGQIGPDGNHSITTNVGEVKVRVTRDSSFHLEARTDVGEIMTDLNLENENENQEVISNQIEGDYGDDNPEATLTITTDVGAIEIRD